MSELGKAIALGTGFSSLHDNSAVRAYRLPDESVHLLCLYLPEQRSTLTAEFLVFSSLLRPKPLVLSSTTEIAAPL